MNHESSIFYVFQKVPVPFMKNPHMQGKYKLSKVLNLNHLEGRNTLKVIPTRPIDSQLDPGLKPQSPIGRLGYHDQSQRDSERSGARSNRGP